jgi:hypothetical protein
VEASAPVGDVSCGVFGRLRGLDRGAINRFVVGEDTQPRALTPEQAGAELGDPFATLVLLQGTFPTTAAGALEALAAAAGAGSPLASHRSFVLGEGGQLAAGAPPDVVDGAIRFVVSTGTDGDGPDVIVSAFHPASSDIELMAWDLKSDGFNFYRAIGDPPAWVFAGNSRHALSEPTRGKGPFESHASGALLMKELKIPWNSWHSFEAQMPNTVFPPGDARLTHPWFTEKEGAENCETAVAVPSMERWARARFARVLADGGELSDPGRVLEQVVDTPTVNLVSSRAEGHNPAAKGGVKVSPTFFFDSDTLTSEEIGLAAAASEFGVPTEIYEASIEKFGFALRDDGSGFEQKGDTKFAFLVPERAREDVVVVQEAIGSKLISDRLAAALLMVDFPNPIFSPRRKSLLAHVPASAKIADGASGFSEEMAAAILAAAKTAGPDSAEAEFAERWEVGLDFKPAFDELLRNYLEAVVARLGTQEGFDDYVRLAESRRRRAKRTLPIAREFSLLFPVTNIADEERAMRPDGTVTTVAT